MAKKRAKPEPKPTGVRNRIKRHVRMRAGDLVPHEGNWRTHPPEQADALRGLYDEVGFARSLLAYETPGGGLKLIDGHLRRDLDPDMVVDVEVLDVTEDEAKKLLAVIDPLSALAGRDEPALAALLAEVSTRSGPLQAMLDGLKAPAAIPDANDPGGGGDGFDATPEAQGPTRTNAGEVWVIGGKHRLFVGDCTQPENVERLMGGAKAAVVITSPPYNQQLGAQAAPTGMHKANAWFNRLGSAYADEMPEDAYQDWQVAVLTLWHDHVREGGALFYNHKHRYRDRRPIIPLDWIRRTPWRLRQEIVWDRRGGVAANASMFIPGDERIYWLEKDGPHIWNGVGNNRTTVWPISPQQNDGQHVCPYPVELVAVPMEATTDQGDYVADPFLGSGTTLIAAHRLGRVCHGCELEPRYADVILKRAEAEGLACERVPSPPRNPERPQRRRRSHAAK